MFTKHQKAILKAYWRHLRLRVRANGTVEAKRSPTGAWGLLLTKEQADACLRNHKERKGLA